MYGEELKEIYGQPTLGPWNLSHVRTWPFFCVLWPLRETVGSEQWGTLEEVLRNRFQSDAALRFLDVKLPDQQGLHCVQLSLGEFELGWGTPGLGHNWEVPPTGLSGCFSPDQMLSWAPHMGSALNILRLLGLPRLSEKSPRLPGQHCSQKMPVSVYLYPCLGSLRPRIVWPLSGPWLRFWIRSSLRTGLWPGLLSAVPQAPSVVGSGPLASQSESEEVMGLAL